MKKTLSSVQTILYSLAKPSLKMKLTYIFFIAAFFQSYASMHGQINKVTLKMEHASVKKIFNSIENKTGYRFLYNIDNVDVNRKTSVFALDKPIKEVLKTIFKDSNIEFVFLDKQIIVKKVVKANKNKAITSNTKNIQKTIEGKVLDQFGEPVYGASIIIKGTVKGVSTGFDGSFSITASIGDTLLINYLSYKEVEVIISDSSTYNITMQPAIEYLDEVVISTGYQKIAKGRTTGSFEKVSDKVLEPKVTQDVISKLEGEVPGLLFNGGAGQQGPQANNRITIRGRNTINGDQRPLIVVDGIPLEEQPFNNLFSDTGTVNPNDIKSITVLKDAAAAAIWGIRAANGVIVIETKKVKRNTSLRVNLSTSTTITQKRKLSNLRIANAADQVQFVRDLLNVTGEDLVNNNQLFDGTITTENINQLNPVVETILRQRNGSITGEEAEARFNELSNIDLRDDLNGLTRNQVWSQYNVGLSGGGDRYDFNASFLHNVNDLERIGNDSKQTIINLRNTYDITDRLTANASINYTKSFIDNGFFGSDPFFVLQNEGINSRILDDQGNYLPMQNGGDSAASLGVSNRLLNDGYLYPQTFNVKQEADNADNTTRITNVRILAGLKYKIFEGLNASVNYQYETATNTERNLLNENRFETRRLVNSFTQVDAAGIATGEFPIPEGSILDGLTEESKSFTVRAQLNFDKKFKDGLHNITAIAGYEVRKTINESRANQRLFGYDDENLSSTQVDLITRFTNPLFTPGIRISDPGFFLGQIFVENRFISSYANASYTYNNKYTLTGSIRLDDTNLFGAADDARNIPLYSGGLKWDLKEELFYNNQGVNGLSLRSSYGVNGNVARGTSNFLQTLTARELDLFNHRSSFIINAPNPRLRLEKTKSFNIGLDFDFFNKHRFFGTIEYYKNVSEDLLANRRLNATSGIPALLLNSGRLRNTGVDVSLGYDVVDTKDFTFTTRGTFSFNDNKLLESDFVANDTGSLTTGRSLRQGDNINTLYAFAYAGLDRDGNPQYFDANNNIISHNDPEINNINNLRKVGLTTPKYFGSWINELSYKNLSLRVLTTFKADYVFRVSREFGSYFDPFYNAFNSLNTSFESVNRWRTRGDENITDIPKIPSRAELLTPGYVNYESSDRQVKDASHIRLRQIALTYAFPYPLMNSIGLNNLDLTFQVDDLAVWTFNDLNIDPENNISQPTSFSLRLSTSF